jgi:hypothetical protein
MLFGEIMIVYSESNIKDIHMYIHFVGESRWYVELPLDFKKLEVQLAAPYFEDLNALFLYGLG